MVFFSLLPYTTIFDAIGAGGRVRFSVRPGVQSVLLREGDSPRVRFYVRSDAQSAPFREVKLKPRSADPRASRPAGWRGVARAHLPS